MLELLDIHTFYGNIQALKGVSLEIAAGEIVPADVHDEVLQEAHVLEINDFNLWYGDKQALFDININVARSKVTALIGPSGCGKSTLLRSVNRMNDLIDSVTIKGEMLLGGDQIYGKAVFVYWPLEKMGVLE